MKEGMTGRVGGRDLDQKKESFVGVPHVQRRLTKVGKDKGPQTVQMAVFPPLWQFSEQKSL